MTIQEAVRKYDSENTEHDRYRSWEHCYTFFQNSKLRSLPVDREQAALQLGFFLASWGMYRGSSFLLNYTYTIHLSVIDTLFSAQFDRLWDPDFGSRTSDRGLTALILKAVLAIREAYRPFAPSAESRQASDTLVTKIMLATLGCLPACDRFFINGFTKSGYKYSYVNENFVTRILEICRNNLAALEEERARIETARPIRYPFMKLIDMYFWQIGFDADSLQKDG